MSETEITSENTSLPAPKERKKRKLPKGMTPWKPGQSGNPRGRPKKDYLLSELAQEKTEEALTNLCQIMNNKSASANARVAAAAEILDRGWGRAPQSLELNHNMTFSDQFEAFLQDLHTEHKNRVRNERMKVIDHIKNGSK